jgi:hypothetical protein
MGGFNGLKLSQAEISAMFADPAWSSRFPPILDLEQAAELARVPLETLRSWRSRGLLGDCSHKPGKRVLIVRDRFVAWLFGSDVTTISAPFTSRPNYKPRTKYNDQ